MRLFPLSAFGGSLYIFIHLFGTALMPDHADELSYGSYLELDRLLSSQHPITADSDSPAHDEMLFIIVHQVYELWFKEIITELDSVRSVFMDDYVDESQIGKAAARLERITKIQNILIEQLEVLETMTPLDFLEFRDKLHPASGFQSVQFRLIENKLGLKKEQRLAYMKDAYHSVVSDVERAVIETSETERSLFELVDSWLARTPFLQFEGFDFWDSYAAAVEKMLNHELETIENNPTLTEAARHEEVLNHKSTRRSFEAILDVDRHGELVKEGELKLSHEALQGSLMIFLYRDEPIFHLPFRLLTALIDIDELLTSWRYRHTLMVQRMIGRKIGTGGSSGYRYLREAAEKHKVFGDLANLSSFLIPRSDLPELPAEFRRHLGFLYTDKIRE